MTEEFAQIAAAPRTKTSNKRTSRLFKAGAMVAVSAGMLGTIGGVASATPSTTSSGTTTANAVVESGITLTGLTSSFTLTGTPGQTVTSAGAVAYNVETNSTTGYGVTVEANTPNMTPAIPGNTDVIPVSVLTVKETSAGSYQALSSTLPDGVHQQDLRSANGGDNLSTDFRMRMPVVNADTYSADLTYTATSL